MDTSQDPATRRPHWVLFAVGAIILAGGGTALSVFAPAPAPASSSQPSSPRPGALPSFHEVTGDLLDISSLHFNPTGEFIFPSVFHASEYLAKPLGNWYLYYSPHEGHGGIALAYSDSLRGPWIEYPGNPIIQSNWPDHYSVSHVASPDAVWNPRENRVFVYFHGENDTTRFAISMDGLSFDYGGIAVSSLGIGGTSTEASYARVFPDPGEKGWAMFFMENTVSDHRRIRIARSPDGRQWTVGEDVLITGAAQGDKDVSGANLWIYHKSLYVVYHTSSGTIYARSIERSLRTATIGEPIPLFSPTDGSGTSIRAAAPEIVQVGDSIFMFFESGERLKAKIALAMADDSDSQQ